MAYININVNIIHMANTKKAEEDKLKQQAIGLSDKQKKEIDTFFEDIGEKAGLSAFVRMSIGFTIDEGNKAIKRGEGLTFWNDLRTPF